MLARDYNCAALTIFDRIEFAVNGRPALKAPLDRACCRDSKKTGLPTYSAIKTIKTRPTYRGFFVGAVCKYGSDKQPNDASVSATRTCAGGNGGLYHRASAGASSLLGQAFKPEFEDVEVCDCHKRRTAPKGYPLTGQATT